MATIGIQTLVIKMKSLASRANLEIKHRSVGNQGRNGTLWDAKCRNLSNYFIIFIGTDAPKRKKARQNFLKTTHCSR